MQTASITPHSITGLILAGGRGSRMGRVDKGLQAFRGAPMAQQVMRRLAPQVGPVLINANRHFLEYAAFGVPLCSDLPGEFAGPLAGLQAGLSHCKTPYLVTAPCDSPFLPIDLVQRLGEALIAGQADLAVAVTGQGAGRQMQPVFCLLKSTLLTSLTLYLQDGGRKIAAWHTSLKVAEVNFDDEAAFRNINTLADLQKFETV